MEDLQNVEEQQESSSKSKIDLRREARRKKILGNAKSRLERLGGVASDIKVEQPEQFSDPEVEPDIPVYNEQVEHNANFTPPTLNTATAQKRNVFLTTRLHIIILGLLTYVVSVFGSEQIGGFSIFIPSGLVIVSELIYFRQQRPVNPMTNLILTLCGLQPQKAGQILHLLSIVQSLLVDVGALIFVFCMTTFLLTCTSDNLANLVIMK